MGVTIIDSDGNTTYDSDNEKKKREERDKGSDVPYGYVDPQLEIHIPDGDRIRRDFEDEQAIITEIRKKLPTEKLPN